MAGWRVIPFDAKPATAYEPPSPPSSLHHVQYQLGIQTASDDTFAKLDRAAPVRRADEAPMDYLRRLAIVGKKYIPKSEEVHAGRRRRPDFLGEGREAVERSLYRTDNMQPGLRAVMRVDGNMGQKIREFYGPTSFVRDFSLPARRVVRINAPATNALYEAQSWSEARRNMAGIG